MGLLMGMILVMALLDMLGVASILPFMAVLANPDLVQTNALLNTAFTISRHIGILTTNQFLFAFGVLIFVLLITSLASSLYELKHRNDHFMAVFLDASG